MQMLNQRLLPMNQLPKNLHCGTGQVVQPIQVFHSAVLPGRTTTMSAMKSQVIFSMISCSFLLCQLCRSVLLTANSFNHYKQHGNHDNTENGSHQHSTEYSNTDYFSCFSTGTGSCK